MQRKRHPSDFRAHATMVQCMNGTLCTSLRATPGSGLHADTAPPRRPFISTLDDIAVWAREMVRWARTGTEDGARLSAQVGAPLRQVREDLRERVRLRCGRNSELPDAEADTRAQARLPPRNERA